MFFYNCKVGLSGIKSRKKWGHRNSHTSVILHKKENGKNYHDLLG